MPPEAVVTDPGQARGFVDTLEPAHVWVWSGDRQASDTARTAARIVSSSPSSGSLPSMRSPST